MRTTGLAHPHCALSLWGNCAWTFNSKLLLMNYLGVHFPIRLDGCNWHNDSFEERVLQSCIPEVTPTQWSQGF